jgi:alpha-ketoglutarate-dependent taurine dioxygenase
MKIEQSKFERLKNLKPKKVEISKELVKIEKLEDDKIYPIVFKPVYPDVNVCTWISNNRNIIDEYLHKCGGILFRGFGLQSIDDFDSFLRSFHLEILEYKNRSSPRHEIKNNIYTSTDHPSDQFINMHNEHSYSSEWPLKIAFFCFLPSLHGGQTPVADSRKVLSALSEKTKEKFIRKNILYKRNLGTGMGMSWREVFQTNDRAKVEQYCKASSFNYQWLDDDRLTLEFARPAIRLHPKTNEPIWFNHAFFFNLLSLDRSLVEGLESQDNENLLPFLTYYGDGSKIEREVIEEIREVYSKLMVQFNWAKGDVLLLDNMLMAHGRNSYSGDRKILVGMLEPHKF